MQTPSRYASIGTISIFLAVVRIEVSNRYNFYGTNMFVARHINGITYRTIVSTLVAIYI